MLGGVVVHGAELETTVDGLLGDDVRLVPPRPQRGTRLLRRRASTASTRVGSVVGMTARLFWAGWLFHLKGLTNSLFFLLVSVLQPVIFASIAFFMVDTGSQGSRRARSCTSPSAPG